MISVLGYFRLIAINVIVLGVLLVVIEGLTSYTLLLYDIVSTSPLIELAERKHTKYDPDLGWVNEPNIYIADLYGPGASLRVNSQGFRNDRDFDIVVPKGKLRIICSGDSFTLGYGVDNEHAWCELLTSLDSRLETLNMGQGGYGVDQAYLWYKRDGSKFEHQIQLLAFITDDFRRMSSDTFFGYPKPVIKEQHDALFIENVPVPWGTYAFPWLTTSLENVSRLHTLQFSNMVLRKIGFISRDGPQSTGSATHEQTRKVLRKIFEDLKHLNGKHVSQLVFVYFPTLIELSAEDPRDWIAFIEGEARAQDIALINFFDDFRSLPPKEVAKMYRKDQHFTERGNEFVTKALYEKLKNHPNLSKVFARELHN